MITAKRPNTSLVWRISQNIILHGFATDSKLVILRFLNEFRLMIMRGEPSRELRFSICGYSILTNLEQES